ncbi:hypothetical protein V1282_005385 [Nitrobacteraceae bacterium AZCC 2146]
MPSLLSCSIAASRRPSVMPAGQTMLFRLTSLSHMTTGLRTVDPAVVITR